MSFDGSILRRVLILAIAVGMLAGCEQPCEVTTEVEVMSAADMEAISHCEVMQGQLIVMADDIETFSLPKLREIAGAIYFNGAENLKSVRFDALERVDHTGIPRGTQAGIAFQLNPKLETVSFPRLTTVGSATRDGGIGVSLNGELRTLELPVLERLFGGVGLHDSKVKALTLPRLKRLTELSVRNNTPLESVSLPDLEALESDLRINGQHLLHTLDLPKLRSIGSAPRGALELIDTGITELSFPDLETIGLSLTVERNFALVRIEVGGVMDVLPVMVVEENASLVELAMPHVLEVGTFRVRTNATLEALRFEDLREVDGMEVTANPKLSRCVVDALVAQVEARDGVRQVINEQNLQEPCDG